MATRQIALPLVPRGPGLPGALSDPVWQPDHHAIGMGSQGVSFRSPARRR